MADFNGGVADFEDELWWSLSLLLLLDEELLFNFGILPGTSWKKKYHVLLIGNKPRKISVFKNSTTKFVV